MILKLLTFVYKPLALNGKSILFENLLFHGFDCRAAFNIMNDVGLSVVKSFDIDLHRPSVFCH